MQPLFSYVITIHNKEQLLRRVLEGVAQCASRRAVIIPVLDGCPDGSAEIVEKFSRLSPIEVRVVCCPDVHEVRSLNAGLAVAQPGYCILVQDDVIIHEASLETLVHTLCEEYGRRIGYLSLRLAADVRKAPTLKRLRRAIHEGDWRYAAAQVDLYNLVGGPDEQLSVDKTSYCRFTERMVGIKSPVCLTPELRTVRPYLDAMLAPYTYDDVEMSLFALECGMINGVLPIHYESQVEWGGTHCDPAFSSASGLAVQNRNRILVWNRYQEIIDARRRSAKRL
jgi:glycosyltransferase involved in cell wall biosynthesis